MPLHVQGLNYDSKGNRANVVLSANDATGNMVQIMFQMNTTGNETQNQVNAMLKAAAKALSEEAATLLT
jgi:hypothetical protein